MSKAVLQLEAVSKSYGAGWAVDNVSAELREGEILTLLGPSGCGKTTTLRLVVGLERCDRGVLRAPSQVLDAPAGRVFVPPNRRNMGMVFQSYAIWPHMTVAENIAYPLQVRRRPSAEIATEVSRVLELVGLPGFEKRAATRLSGGQQQRVAIARSLVSNPEILLLDEPFSNLDAKLREQMRSEIKMLQRRLGITVLFVTHDQTEALALSDRIAVMSGGRLEQVGPPQELYVDPRTVHVRDFLGRTLRFPGRVVETSATAHLVELKDGTRVQIAGPARGGAVAAQDQCVVAIRPEFAVAAPGHPAPGPNELRARLMALLFLGDCYEASLTLGNGEDILVTLPASGEWNEGQELSLRLPPERLQLWSAEAA